MKALVYGSTIGAAYLAARLAREGWELDWQLTEFRARLRPTRLSAEVVRNIRKLAAPVGERLEFISRAPEFASWGSPSGARYRFAWGFDAADRWVDRATLFETLKKVAAASGAKINEERLLAPPELERFGEVPIFLDAPLEELTAWPLALDRERAERVEATELWLPQGRISEGSPCQFVRLEGALAFLEPHPLGGYALSFYASSRYPLERALLSLRDPRGSGPASWRALFMLNPGAQVRNLSFRLGGGGFLAPGAFAFGESLGLSNPGANLHDIESLDQAERLARFWEKPGNGESILARSETWTMRESGRLGAMWGRGRLMEKLFFSDEARKYALPAASFVPRALRRLLHAPV